MNINKSIKASGILLFIIVISIISLAFAMSMGNFLDQIEFSFFGNENLNIIATDEAKDICQIIEDYAEKQGKDVTFTYAGSLEIIDILNQNEEDYDAVFLSNSIWMSMLDTSKNKISDYETISINPVVFGVKKSIAKDLGLIKDNLLLSDIVNVIKQGKLKFTMPSGTRTNTGASSLLGFVTTLCGNPEVLTIEHVKNENLSKELVSLFAGVNKSSGSEGFIEQLYINGKCDAAILYETSIININKQIQNENDQIYALYPLDGVSVSDLLFGFIDSEDEGKKEFFTELKTYLLSQEVQSKLLENGHRVWYGGVKKDADSSIFNSSWGIDTTKYITPIKYPSMKVINEIFNLYQSELRKPTHTIFALDFSGSMYGEGYHELVYAMNYILDYEEASKDYVQFSDKDIVTIIPFSTSVIDKYTAKGQEEIKDLITKITETDVAGGTNIYDTVTEALKTLKSVDSNNYNCSIVIMTDGVGNNGSRSKMIKEYNSLSRDIPVYSILFGDASEEDMEDIASLTGGKVFDGKENLKYAFKLVRGYN